MVKLKRILINIAIIFGVLLFAGVILYIKFVSVSNPAEEIVKCIGESSVLYVQAGCPHCSLQIQKFGDKLEFLEIVDCTKTPKKCVAKGITNIPTWIFNNTYVKGVYSIEELKEMMNC